MGADRQPFFFAHATKYAAAFTQKRHTDLLRHLLITESRIIMTLKELLTQVGFDDHAR